MCGLMCPLPGAAQVEKTLPKAGSSPLVQQQAAKTYADGWHKDQNGDYFYTRDNKRLTGWYKISGKTYYFDADGIMAKGWLKVGDDSYYLKSDGTKAANETLEIGGKKYTFDKEGRASAAQQKYILNNNSQKFHLPGCKSVKRMKKENRTEYTGTREELIRKHYDPCENCNP